MLATQLCLTLCDSMTVPARLFCPWDSLGKNAGVGCHALLQGIFLTQGLTLCLLHWQMDSLSSESAGRPSILLGMLRKSSLQKKGSELLPATGWRGQNRPVGSSWLGFGCLFWAVHGLTGLHVKSESVCHSVVSKSFQLHGL